VGTTKDPTRNKVHLLLSAAWRCTAVFMQIQEMLFQAVDKNCNKWAADVAIKIEEGLLTVTVAKFDSLTTTD